MSGMSEPEPPPSTRSRGGGLTASVLGPLRSESELSTLANGGGAMHRPPAVMTGPSDRSNAAAQQFIRNASFGNLQGLAGGSGNGNGAAAAAVVGGVAGGVAAAAPPLNPYARVSRAGGSTGHVAAG